MEGRIARHETVDKNLYNTFLNKTISSCGFHTRIAPANTTPVGIQYPDIITWKGNICEIIDTMIWADNFVINEAHSCKVAYYINPL